MNQHELLLSISKYLSRFNEQVYILNKNGEFSINIHAENILINILNILFDADFENVNYSENKVFDTIDIRDKNDNIAIQITATSNISKIKKTLKGYLENNHYKRYKKIKILVLGSRQKKYDQNSINKIIQPYFQFCQDEDIIDLSTIYLLLNKQNDLKKINEVERILAAQFRDRESSIIINTYLELCKTILPLFEENQSIFNKVGPNSSADSVGDIRWDMTLWYNARRDIILPNNKIILDLLKQYREVIPKEHVDIFADLSLHLYAFEKHCEDEGFDYTQYQFPKKIIEVVKNGVCK